MKKTALFLCALLSGSSICVAINRTDLLPEEDAVQFHISNVEVLKTALLKTPVARLCMDEQFAAFLNLPVTNLFQTSEDDSPSQKQFKLIKGEMAVSVSVPDGTPFFAVELSPKDYEEYCLLQDKIVADDEMTRKNHTFQDIPLVEEVAFDDVAIWRAYYQNTVLEGTNREQIEKALMKLKSAELDVPSGGAPFFKIVAPRPEQLTAALIAAATSEEDPDRPQTVNFPALIDALGLSTLRRMEASFVFQETETVIELTVQGSELIKGLFAMEKTGPVHLPPAGFIPADLFYFRISQPDIPTIWAELVKIVSAANPMAGVYLAQLPAVAQQLCAVDFQQELLNPFGNIALSYNAPGAETPRAGVALELNSGNTLKNALDKILATPSLAQQTAAIKQETFRDVTLYELSNIQSEDPVTLAILPDYFLYGTSENVRTMIRAIQVPSDSASYLNNELIQELTARAPDTACALGAIKGKEYAGIFLQELQKPQYRSRIEQSEWSPDFDKLPSSQHIGSFFRNAFSWTEASPGQWTVTFLLQN